MDLVILEFTAPGSPRDLSTAIEQSAQTHGSLNAIVVPWESDKGELSMAVTSVNKDGWAIEHTNLGTIKLTDLGDSTTKIVVTSHGADQAEKKRSLTMFENFAKGMQTRLQSTR